jgi:hypothetical protein
MKNILKPISLFFVLAALVSSCKKDFDDPTVKVVATGNVLTIAEARALYQPGKITKITEDISVFGVVTMDETTGNLYKESYITDDTGNLYLRFTTGSGLYIGDSVRVNLNGANILKYNQMLQVDSLHPDNSVVKLSTQKYHAPEIVTITSLLSDLDAAQGKLVQIDGAFFVDGVDGLTYADGTTQTSGDRDIFTLSAEKIEVRTSGYANFADEVIPEGTGSFIGIVAQYQDGLQLLVRDPNELTMEGNIPEVKTFNDNSVTSGGWTTQVVTGSFDWTLSDQGANTGDFYANISNYVSPNNIASEAWLISPAYDFSLSTNPTLGFQNASNYGGPDLDVYVSTNYDGVSSPSSATWTPLQFVLSPGGFEFVSSSLINLSSYLGANTYIGFKYTGTSSDGKTWEIDNIVINK